MTNEITFIKNEQLLSTKKLLGSVSAFNASCFGIYSAIGAVNGQYMIFVVSFLLCIINIVFFMYGYNKYRGENS